MVPQRFAATSPYRRVPPAQSGVEKSEPGESSRVRDWCFGRPHRKAAIVSAAEPAPADVKPGARTRKAPGVADESEFRRFLPACRFGTTTAGRTPKPNQGGSSSFTLARAGKSLRELTRRGVLRELRGTFARTGWRRAFGDSSAA